MAKKSGNSFTSKAYDINILRDLFKDLHSYFNKGRFKDMGDSFLSEIYMACQTLMGEKYGCDISCGNRILDIFGAYSAPFINLRTYDKETQFIGQNIIYISLQDELWKKKDMLIQGIKRGKNLNHKVAGLAFGYPKKDIMLFINKDNKNNKTSLSELNSISEEYFPDFKPLDELGQELPEEISSGLKNHGTKDPFIKMRKRLEYKIYDKKRELSIAKRLANSIYKLRGFDAVRKFVYRE